MRNSHVMTPEHPRWGEFIAELARAERCKRTTEHARITLESMAGIDVIASLDALDAMGGDCDCAILFDLRERVAD